MSLEVPVIFFVFNRPALTERVFAAIAQAQPKELFVFADGPRAQRPEDAERCAAVRKIVERVDWPCKLHKDFAPENMGCRSRVLSGINAVLGTAEHAIILEDDCIPHPTFFRYCTEILEYYRDDRRVMTISGANFPPGWRRTPYSYYFSRYTSNFGAWATWHRAWKLMDSDMKLWPELRDGGWLRDMLADCPPSWWRVWRKNFEDVYNGNSNLWDYQWGFACWINSGLAVLPSANLVSNIGFDSDATNCCGSSPVANLPLEEMRFPLSHPPFVMRDAKADDLVRRIFEPTLGRRVMRRLEAWRRKA